MAGPPLRKGEAVDYHKFSTYIETLHLTRKFSPAAMRTLIWLLEAAIRELHDDHMCHRLSQHLLGDQCRRGHDNLADAKHIGCEIIDWFYDAGVSGDLEVSERPGFTTMLDRVDGNGVRTVIVESAERFARKMLTAKLGI